MDEVLISKYSPKKEISAEMPTEILFTVHSVRCTENRKLKIQMWWKLHMKAPNKMQYVMYSVQLLCMLIIYWGISNLSFLKILCLSRIAYTLVSWLDLLFENVSFPTKQGRIDIATSATNSIFILSWPPVILNHSKLREVRNFSKVPFEVPEFHWGHSELKWVWLLLGRIFIDLYQDQN